MQINHPIIIKSNWKIWLTVQTPFRLPALPTGIHQLRPDPQDGGHPVHSSSNPSPLYLLNPPSNCWLNMPLQVSAHQGEKGKLRKEAPGEASHLQFLSMMVRNVFKKVFGNFFANEQSVCDMWRWMPYIQFFPFFGRGCSPNRPPGGSRVTVIICPVVLVHGCLEVWCLRHLLYSGYHLLSF